MDEINKIREQIFTTLQENCRLRIQRTEEKFMRKLKAIQEVRNMCNTGDEILFVLDGNKLEIYLMGFSCSKNISMLIAESLDLKFPITLKTLHEREALQDLLKTIIYKFPVLSGRLNIKKRS